jgi:hypothetical protein
MRTCSLDAFPQQPEKPLEDLLSSCVVVLVLQEVKVNICLQPCSLDPRHLRQNNQRICRRYKENLLEDFLTEAFFSLKIAGRLIKESLG